VAKEAHPEDVLGELKASLAAGLAPGYVVRGDELFYRNAALDLLRARARQTNLELCAHDTKESGFDAQRVQDDLLGGGLFSSGRLVIVSAPEDLLKKDDGKDRPVARAIQKFLGAKGGTVVLVAEGLRADNSTVKAIVASGGRVLSFRKLYDKPAPWERNPDPRRTEVCEWVVGRAKTLGVKLSSDQAVLLVAAVGGELGALDGKLGELRHSGSQDFFENLDAAAPVSPFELASTLARGDLAASLRDTEGLFHSGFKSKDGRLEVKADALREILFSGLRAQVRRGLAASLAVRAGKSPEEAAKEAGVSAFQMRDFQAALAARDHTQWRAMSADLGRLERKARSGHTVDASDLAVFAVRWRRSAATVSR
jgi:DNA polymerase III delta subunit